MQHTFINMSSNKVDGDSYFLFEVKDSQGLDSDEKRFDLRNFYNYYLTSTPQIDTIGTVTVDDNGGAIPSTVMTISGTDLQVSAQFSIVNDPTSGKLTVD